MHNPKDTPGEYNLASISENLATINVRICAQARSCGRRARSITLIAVSKTKPAEAIVEAYLASQHHFAENYVREGVSKITQLADLPITWHFIGTVQSNKTALIARHFHWVHSIDRVKIAKRLGSHRDPENPLNVLLQINIDADPAKGGVTPKATPELLAAVGGLPGIRVRGLMTVLEKAGAPDLSFAHMRDLFESMRPHGGNYWDTLSMGMSRDMDAAIAQGATHLRIGSAIFGPREPSTPATTRPSPS